MSEPRVFLDQDLRRIASYEVARSFPLPPQVALSSSVRPLRLSTVCSFYGLDSPFVSLACAFALDCSLVSTLSSSAPYESRLAHAAGRASDPLRVVDLRPASQPTSDLVLSSVPAVPVRGEGRPSGAAAQVVPESGQPPEPQAWGGAEPGAGSDPRAASAGAEGAGIEEVES